MMSPKLLETYRQYLAVKRAFERGWINASVYLKERTHWQSEHAKEAQKDATVGHTTATLTH